MSEGAIERPEYAEGQSPSVYNVATWGKLDGEKIEHEEYGVGVVTRSNTMSKEVWARFDDGLHILDMSEVELVAEVRSLQADTGRGDSGE